MYLRLEQEAKTEAKHCCWDSDSHSNYCADDVCFKAPSTKWPCPTECCVRGKNCAGPGLSLPWSLAEQDAKTDLVEQDIKTEAKHCCWDSDSHSNYCADDVCFKAPSTKWPCPTECCVRGKNCAGPGLSLPWSLAEQDAKTDLVEQDIKTEAKHCCWDSDSHSNYCADDVCFKAPSTKWPCPTECCVRGKNCAGPGLSLPWSLAEQDAKTDLVEQDIKTEAKHCCWDSDSHSNYCADDVCFKAPSTKWPCPTECCVRGKNCAGPGLSLPWSLAEQDAKTDLVEQDIKTEAKHCCWDSDSHSNYCADDVCFKAPSTKWPCPTECCVRGKNCAGPGLSLPWSLAEQDAKTDLVEQDIKTEAKHCCWDSDSHSNYCADDVCFKAPSTKWPCPTECCVRGKNCAGPGLSLPWSLAEQDAKTDLVEQDIKTEAKHCCWDSDSHSNYCADDVCFKAPSTKWPCPTECCVRGKNCAGPGLSLPWSLAEQDAKTDLVEQDIKTEAKHCCWDSDSHSNYCADDVCFKAPSTKWPCPTECCVRGKNCAGPGLRLPWSLAEQDAKTDLVDQHAAD